MALWRPWHYDEVLVVPNTLKYLGCSHDVYFQHRDVQRKGSDVHHCICNMTNIKSTFFLDIAISLQYAFIESSRHIRVGVPLIEASASCSYPGQKGRKLYRYQSLCK